MEVSLWPAVGGQRRDARNLEVALVAGGIARVEDRRGLVDDVGANAHKRLMRAAHDRQAVPHPQVRNEALARVILDHVPAQPRESALQTHSGELARLGRAELGDRLVEDIDLLGIRGQRLGELDDTLGVGGELLFVLGLVVAVALGGPARGTRPERSRASAGL